MHISDTIIKLNINYDLLNRVREAKNLFDADKFYSSKSERLKEQAIRTVEAK